MFNELVEEHCRQNGIDPMKLLQNGQENVKIFHENEKVNGIEKQKLDLHRYPRSQEPIDLMKMYSKAELKGVCPKKIVKE